MTPNLSLFVGESFEKIQKNVFLSLLEFVILRSLRKHQAITCDELTKEINAEFRVEVPSGTVVVALFSMEAAGLVERQTVRCKDSYCLTEKGNMKLTLFKVKKGDVLGFTEILLKES